MNSDKSEACGRCAMSSVISTAAEGKDGTARAQADPFAGSRIEIHERELRSVSPGAWLSGLKSRMDDLATRLTYGK